MADGARRAAALLLGLGSEGAAAIFRHLDESEVRQIAIGAKELRRAPANAVPDALNQFLDSMVKVGGDAVAGDDVLRSIVSTALGNDMVRRAFDGVLPPPPPDEVLGPVANADPEALAMVLAREQPQTVALVLSALEPSRAAEVMDHLPATQRPQIVRRMATVESVSPEVLREVRQALTQELNALVAEGMRKLDGRKAALEVLRRSPNAEQTEVLAAIEKDDSALASELRAKLFTFDDLKSLSARDIQTLSKDLDMGQLTLALKGASPEIRDRFLKNMSSRAAELLADDIAAMGPTKLSVVEAAQTAIAKLAVELAEQGRITIVRPTDQML